MYPWIKELLELVWRTEKTGRSVCVSVREWGVIKTIQATASLNLVRMPKKVLESWGNLLSLALQQELLDIIDMEIQWIQNNDRDHCSILKLFHLSAETVIVKDKIFIFILFKENGFEILKFGITCQNKKFSVKKNC